MPVHQISLDRRSLLELSQLETGILECGCKAQRGSEVPGGRIRHIDGEVLDCFQAQALAQVVHDLPQVLQLQVARTCKPHLVSCMERTEQGRSQRVERLQ